MMRSSEYLVQIWTGGECGEYVTCKRTAPTGPPTTGRNRHQSSIVDVSVWAKSSPPAPLMSSREGRNRNVHSGRVWRRWSYLPYGLLMKWHCEELPAQELA